MSEFCFYFTAVCSVLCALGVILSANPVQSVLMLLGSFLAVAVTYLLAGFQFLAAIQILVYGGAIMVLFLFVVMLLNLGDPETVASEPLFHGSGRVAGGLATALVFLSLLLLGIAGTNLPEVQAYLWPAGGLDPMLGLAEQLLGPFVLAFEGASVLLLVTAVGVLVLAKRQRGKPGAALEEAKA